MRSWFSRRNVVFSLFVGVALIVLLFGLGLLPFGANSTNQPPLSQATTTFKTPRNNVIVHENAHHGTSSWKIPSGHVSTTQIQAYTGATSVSPGQKLTFFVSTQQDKTSYSIDIYRLGWYGGLGGRLMTSKVDQIGHAQGYYNPAISHLMDCRSCLVNANTGLVEANWQPSYILTVPAKWVTGVYLAKFTDVNGMQTYAPFDVRGNISSHYVAVTSDTTYAAYNHWGGASLYDADNGFLANGLTRAVKVSFDRPYLQDDGSGHVLVFEADAIHWLESLGYDLSYISSVDLHEDPKQLLHHRAYISLGHDEYWTKEMRDGVEHARDWGVGLAFLEANASYWQMRFEPDSVGTPDRTIVCYKVETINHDLARDPLYRVDNARVTTQWRDPVLARPENALIGIMYSNLTHQQRGFPWQVSPTAASPLLDGTDLTPGRQFGCGLVGYEWDRLYANGASPPGLKVLAVSPTTTNDNIPDISNTTYYIASSGAMVFATGAIYWTAALDSYRFDTDPLCQGQNPVVPGMQKLMAHVMDALLIRHAHNY